jgi:hypothetical protein
MYEVPLPNVGGTEPIPPKVQLTFSLKNVDMVGGVISLFPF